MYYKIIGGRQVFSACKTIQTNEGAWVSNPSEEQILDAGWLPYVPPEVIPEPQEEPGFGEVIEAVKRVLSSSAEELSDEEALEVAALFPTWVSKLPEDPLNPKPEDTLPAGYKLWYDTKLYKVLQPHVPQENWRPDKTPSLFAEVTLSDGGTIDNPIHYSTGMELVKDNYYTENDVLYLCVRDLAASYWALADLVGQYVEVVVK